MNITSACIEVFEIKQWRLWSDDLCASKC